MQSQGSCDVILFSYSATCYNSLYFRFMSGILNTTFSFKSNHIISILSCDTRRCGITASPQVGMTNTVIHTVLYILIVDFRNIQKFIIKEILWGRRIYKRDDN